MLLTLIYKVAAKLWRMFFKMSSASPPTLVMCNTEPLKTHLRLCAELHLFSFVSQVQKNDD